MNHALLLLTSYVINAIWQLPLIAAVGLGLSRWLKQTGPELQHKLWVAVLILATLTPATPIFRQIFGPDGSRSNVTVSARSVLPAVAGRDVSPTGSYMVLRPTAIYVLSGFYIAVLMFFLLRLCRVLRSTAALIRNAGPASIDPDYAAMWNHSKARFSAHTASLLCSGDVPGPVTAGVFRPVLLLPAAFLEEHSRNEFLAAIGHECAHMERNDFRKNVFYEAVALLTAFHPATWFIKSQIAQTREMVCDRMAAERLLDGRTYGESLLQMALKMPAMAPSTVFHTMGMFDANILERRIMTIMTSLPRVSRVQRYSLGLTATLLLSVCAAVSGSFTQPVAAQTSNASVQSPGGKTSANGKDLSCTFYTFVDNKDVPSPGTCGVDARDKSKYVCYSELDQSKSQDQIGCKAKLEKAGVTKK